MESKKGENMILEALKGSNINYLYEALEVTKIDNIIDIIISELNDEVERKNIKKNKFLPFLKVLAKSDEKKALDYIESIFVDIEIYKFVKKEINLESIIHILQKRDSDKVKTLLYKIYDNNYDYVEQRLCVDAKLLSKEDMYEKNYKLFIDNKEDCRTLSTYLSRVYNIGVFSIGKNYEDIDKNWDIRWANLFIELNDIYTASFFVYDKDERTLEKILEKWLTGSKERYGSILYNYIRILAKLYKNNHSRAKIIYNKIISKGYKKHVVIGKLMIYGIEIRELD